MNRLLNKPIKLALLAVFLFGFCQCLSAQTWTLVQGIIAQDISVGKNDATWATGTDGYVYRWSGSSWQPITGKLSADALNNAKRQDRDPDKSKTVQKQPEVTISPSNSSRIAVDPEGAAWVVTATNQIYKYGLTTRTWTIVPGNAKDIGIGADGSVWIIGTGVTGGGYRIYKWNGSDWTEKGGGAVRIAVDPSGNAWIVNNTNTIFHYNGSGWDTKPGAAKDIGVGANGAVWCTAPDYQIYQWDGSNWKVQTGGAVQISVASDGNAWIANNGGQIYHTTNAVSAFVKIRAIFPRGQTYEYRMLKALQFFPYSNTIQLGGVIPQYTSIDPLGQAFGRLGLLAAEIYSNQSANATAENVLSDVNNFPQIRQKVCGILAVLVMNEISRSAADQQTIALKDWATNLFYSIKVRSAKAVLDEYNKWKNDWCKYEGISNEECRVKGQGITSLFSTQKPPQDLLGKNGLQAVLAKNADAIAVGASLGLTIATTGAAAAALASVLGTTATVSASGILTVTPSLCAAFVPAASAGAAGGATAGAAIGAVGWAGVIAAPVAAAVLCIVVGTVEGFKVVEAAKVEPMFKMKLGAAMSEPIKISNVMADSSGRDMFFIAFQEAAAKGFQLTPPKVDGEARFYCQAGYVSRFTLSYTVNGQNQSLTTPDLPVGQEKSFVIPYNAQNIRVQGWYLSGTWKDLFNVTLDRPTYICYTSYGTIFNPNYKTDCPEVGNMTTKPNELTVTQGGGYSAWIKLTYTQNGQTVTALDQSSTAAGWRKVFSIPIGVTNIRLQIWDATGLAWDPWKTIIDKTWPYPPNECIKVYGTTLDPKWDNECN